MCNDLEFIEYYVCQDCLMYIAYDDVNHENETHASMRKHVDREKQGNRAYFAAGPLRRFMVTYEWDDFTEEMEYIAKDKEDARKQLADDMETSQYPYEIVDIEETTENYESDEFSWRPCDLCQSQLGGSRHAVTLVINQGE